MSHVDATCGYDRINPLSRLASQEHTWKTESLDGRINESTYTRA